jgi:hypothetical protein
MSWLRRWLDPPEAIERKRWLRAQPRPPRRETDVEFGCVWPFALMLAVAIAVGVVAATRLRAERVAPREAIVRVVDVGASPGPRVIATRVIPWLESAP